MIRFDIIDERDDFSLANLEALLAELSYLRKRCDAYELHVAELVQQQLNSVRHSVENSERRETTPSTATR